MPRSAAIVAEGERLTFRYREIAPGSSMLTDDIAIITGVIYNQTRARQRHDGESGGRRTARRIPTGSKEQSGLPKQNYVAGFGNPDLRFLNKLRDKNPEKRHQRVKAHNIVRLCQEFPRKYSAPSDFYFGEIDCIFSPSKDAEIDLAVLAVKGEIEKEDFDKRQKEQNPTQKPAYQNPLVRRDNEDDDW